MKKKNKRIIGGAVVVVTIVVAICAAVYFWPRPQSSVSAGSGTFSTVLVDGVRGESLDERDFDAELWCLPIGEDSTDWDVWEQNLDVDQISDINLDDLDTDEYSRFVVIYNGTTDTVLDDGTGVVYYERQAEIFTDRANTLYAYETPNEGGAFIMWNSASGAYIAHASTNITSSVNFTVMCTINMTQRYAKYVAYWDFSANDWARLSLGFTFNTTCKAAELGGSSGMVRTHPTATTLSFAWNTLDRNPATFDFTWSASPTADIEIDAAETVLAFAGAAI